MYIKTRLIVWIDGSIYWTWVYINREDGESYVRIGKEWDRLNNHKIDRYDNN